MQFKVITHANSQEFSEQVSGYLQSGYRLHGDTRIIEEVGQYTTYRFFQAVVKED